MGGRVKIWQQTWGVEKSQNNFVVSGEWWEVLGVDIDASSHDVKNAYRRLAREYHPDINNSASAQNAMQAISHSYQEFQQKTNRK